MTVLSAFSFVVVPEGGDAGERLLHYNLPGRVFLRDNRMFSLEERAIVLSLINPADFPVSGGMRAIHIHSLPPPGRKMHRLLFTFFSPFLFFCTFYHLYILFINSPLTSYTHKFPPRPSRWTSGSRLDGNAAAWPK